MYRAPDQNRATLCGGKNNKAFLVDLKRVYRAVSLGEAEAALDELGSLRGKKYSIVTKSSRTEGERLSAYFECPEDTRRIIYTTNSIDHLTESAQAPTICLSRTDRCRRNGQVSVSNELHSGRHFPVSSKKAAQGAGRLSDKPWRGWAARWKASITLSETTTSY